MNKASAVFVLALALLAAACSNKPEPAKTAERDQPVTADQPKADPPARQDSAPEKKKPAAIKLKIGTREVTFALRQDGETIEPDAAGVYHLAPKLFHFVNQPTHPDVPGAVCVKVTKDSEGVAELQKMLDAGHQFVAISAGHAGAWDFRSIPTTDKVEIGAADRPGIIKLFGDFRGGEELVESAQKYFDQTPIIYWSRCYAVDYEPLIKADVRSKQIEGIDKLGQFPAGDYTFVVSYVTFENKQSILHPLDIKPIKVKIAEVGK